MYMYIVGQRRTLWGERDKAVYMYIGSTGEDQPGCGSTLLGPAYSMLDTFSASFLVP